MTSAGLRHIAFNNVLNFGRAGRPRPAANQTNTISFRGEVEKSPAREMPPAYTRQPTCLRRLCARQSPKQPFPLPARNIVASPLWLKTVTCGLFLRQFVPPRRASAIPTVTPFPRNDKLYTRVRQFIRINIIKPSAHPYRLVIASEAWQSRGNEDGCGGHEQKSLPWGISPLRSDCRPHSGRNDIINQTNTDVISSVVEKSPATEMPPAYPRQHTCPRRLTVERERSE